MKNRIEEITKNKGALTTLLLLILLLCSGMLPAQNETPKPDGEGSLIQWMTLEEAQQKVKIQPKPIIIDFYTDWCGWCKRMMMTTYANPQLAQYINQNFYPVRFNAETKDTVEYLGKKYGPLGAGQHPTNALAVKLLQNKLMYPTTLFLNSYDKAKDEFGFSMLASGYLDEKKLEPILIFSLENVFRNSSYDDFKAEFDKAFFDTTTESRMKLLKWKKPSEVLSTPGISKKKSLVFIHTSWCNACRVMYRTSFDDTLTKKLLADHFDLVDFDPQTTDTIVYKGQSYINPRSPQYPFHQLAMALTKNNFVLPTLVVMDENKNVLDAIPFYLNPQVLSDIATYYGTDMYKSKTWKDFMKERHPDQSNESNGG